MKVLFLMESPDTSGSSTLQSKKWRRAVMPSPSRSRRTAPANRSGSGGCSSTQTVCAC